MRSALVLNTREVILAGLDPPYVAAARLVSPLALEDAPLRAAELVEAELRTELEERAPGPIGPVHVVRFRNPTLNAEEFLAFAFPL